MSKQTHTPRSASSQAPRAGHSQLPNARSTTEILPLGQDLHQWQPRALLALQHAVGNQVVQRMLARDHPVQPKLTVGPVRDRYEAEADRVATLVSRQVVHRSAVPGELEQADGAQLARKILPIQRFVGDQGGPVNKQIEGKIAQARGGGKQLDGAVRRKMEAGFGQAFPDVRVHTDQRADTLSRSLSARAFTTGKDIFFQRGEYNPHSSDGRHLLAHELTHVVQQTGGAIQRWPWGKKKKKNKKDETDSVTKTPNPYNKVVSKFMPGSDEAVDQDMLSEAQESAGSIDGAVPDYSNPEVADARPDRYTVTVAVAQEEAGWWDMVKKVKKIGLKKMIQSPRKLIRNIKGGEAEEYLLGKMLKYEDRLPKEAEKQAQAIEAASDLFHTVGHTWVRLTTYVGTKVKDHYSFGFWPRKIGDSGGYSMDKYVPGQVRHPDVVHESDDLKRYFVKSVNANQFEAALALAQERFISPPAYHLLDYNCTKFAREIIKAAGGSYPGKGVFPKIGFSPGELFSKLGKRKDKIKPGEQVMEDDPIDTIVESVTQDVDARANEYLEKQGLAPRDPDDFPEGIYEIPITDSIQIKASLEDFDGPLDTDLYFMESDGEARIYVEDEMTRAAGRAYTEQFGRTYFFPIDYMLKPGMTPTYQFDSGDEESSSDSD